MKLMVDMVGYGGVPGVAPRESLSTSCYEAANC